MYYGVGDIVDLDWVRQGLAELPAEDRWERRAIEGLSQGLVYARRQLTRDVLLCGEAGRPVKECLHAYVARHEKALAELRDLDQRHQERTPDDAGGTAGGDARTRPFGRAQGDMMSDLRVTFLGSGDAFSAGGRHQAGYLVHAPEGWFLLDCGATTLMAMKRFGVDAGVIDSIFISHLHGDHFVGIPFLLLEFHYEQGRKRPLRIAGPPGTEERIRALIRATYKEFSGEPLPFALEFSEMNARFADVLRRTCASNRFAYRIRKRRSLWASWCRSPAAGSCIRATPAGRRS